MADLPIRSFRSLLRVSEMYVHLVHTRFSIGLWIDLLFIKENRSLNDSLNLLLEMSVMFLLVSLIIV